MVARVNEFQPLVAAPYGFSGAPKYNRADIPSNWATNSALTPEQLANKLAYEWYNSNEINGNESNPPFTSGAAGRINPTLPNGQKILRGYIRRANYEADDRMSRTRLYFMYNPETIVRDYVSYLDQAALDPFNTVYGSNNLVAPPSFMNFRFDLFFDRQDEVSQDRNNPGVFADYQFFDMVVRNVIPSDPNSTGSTQIPDNGVMMVNPRDITVVFSPQLTVQGRPINAQVVFEKFSHRMTPIRMRIALEMRVVYIGPMRAFTEYTMENYTNETTSSVAPDDTLNFSFTYSDLIIADGGTQGAASYTPSASTAVQGQLQAQADLLSSPNGRARLDALQWAQTYVVPGYTTYNRDKRSSGVDPSGRIKYTDCSALVWLAYEKTLGASKLGWAPWGNTVNMIDTFKNSGWKTAQPLYSWDNAGEGQARVFFSVKSNRDRFQAGDLLFKDRALEGTEVGHVAFLVNFAPDGSGVTIFDASGPGASPQVGERTISMNTFITKYNYVVRPVPFGASAYSSYVNGSPYTGYKY